MRKLPTRLVDYSSLPDGKVKIVGGALVQDTSTSFSPTITSAASGHILRYDGTNWVNVALSGAYITTGTVATARLGSGTASSTTYLRGDGTWATIPVWTPTVIDAKGDLMVGSANDTVTRLGVGTDGQVLTADSAQATGVKWATPTGGGGGASTLDGLTDVDTSTTPPTDGQALVWNNTAAQWKPGSVASGGGGGTGAPVVLLDNGAPVPTGTAAGTVVFTKTASGTQGYTVTVLLIENGASVPAGTPVGTIIAEKA